MLELLQLISMVQSGASRIDGRVLVNGRVYQAKVYWVGEVIRIDLEKG